MYMCALTWNKRGLRTLGGVRYVRGVSRANSFFFEAVDNPSVSGPTIHRSRTP